MQRYTARQVYQNVPMNELRRQNRLAMFQSSRAFMLREGYRPRGSGRHASVVQFMEEPRGVKNGDQITLLD